MIHGGERARNATRRRARPAQGRLTPLLEIQGGNTIQGWQGCAVTTVCTDGRNKMFPSLLFLDRHVAKVEEERYFLEYFFPLSFTSGNKAGAGLAHPEIRESC